MQRTKSFRKENLLKARQACGLSQSQLAHRIGAHFTSVSDWERGKNVPSARHLAGIAEATGQTVDYFMDAASDDEDESQAVDVQAVLHEAAAIFTKLGSAFGRVSA